jgi:hypothetical protein
MPAMVVALIVAAMAAACGSNQATGSPTAPPASPTGSALVGPATPTPTPWPEDVARAIIRLGAMHGELGKAIGELGGAVQREDVAEIRSVADELADFLERNLENARTLEAKTFPELGRPLVAALTKLRDGAVRIRDGIDKGDASAIEAGFTTITEGMRDYAAVQPQVADLVPEAIRQTGGLVR